MELKAGALHCCDQYLLYLHACFCLPLISNIATNTWLWKPLAVDKHVLQDASALLSASPPSGPLKQQAELMVPKKKQCIFLLQHIQKTMSHA